MGPATARAIVEERERGGAFGALEDLLRVRGVGEETLARISEHLDMSDAPRPGRRGTGRDRPVRDPPALDVNTADRDALQRLPGIGPALADRIVEARRRRPFRTLDELTRVTGIGPATVERLRGHASVGPVGR